MIRRFHRLHRLNCTKKITKSDDLNAWLYIVMIGVIRGICGVYSYETCHLER